MIPLLQNGILASDLNANGFKLLNVGSFEPPPDGLVFTDDTRLSDARVPLDGSVTNASVSNTASIAQSKLSLNGNMPPAWLGTASNQAAPGDQAEYTVNKGAARGYASLDPSGLVPVDQIPPAVGTGTITSFGLTMPGDFVVSGSPITGAGTIGVVWHTQPDHSWFGNKSGGSAAPQFYNTALPATLIPNLDTSQVTTGVFDPVLLPDAVGLGGSHSPGAVPDPGDGSGGALATDYLARDMSYKAFPTIGPTYQPTIADPTLTPSTNITGPQTIVFSVTGFPTLGSSSNGAIIFYSLTSASAGFVEIPASGYISLDPSGEVWCYAARSGWNNSNVVNYTNPNP